MAKLNVDLTIRATPHRWLSETIAAMHAERGDLDRAIQALELLVLGDRPGAGTPIEPCPVSLAWARELIRTGGSLGIENQATLIQFATALEEWESCSTNNGAVRDRWDAARKLVKP